jgi:hypothetical protein
MLTTKFPENYERVWPSRMAWPAQPAQAWSARPLVLFVHLHRMSSAQSR